jgi:hypothetical protein
MAPELARLLLVALVEMLERDPELLSRVRELFAAEPERLLDRSQLAERLRVTPGTVDKLRGRGLPVVWVASSPRVEWAAVLEWLKTRRAPLEAAAE